MIRYFLLFRFRRFYSFFCRHWVLRVFQRKIKIQLQFRLPKKEVKKLLVHRVLINQVDCLFGLLHKSNRTQKHEFLFFMLLQFFCTTKHNEIK